MMKKLFLWIWLLMKRQLKNPAVTAFLLGIPVAAIIFANIPSMSEAQEPRIGIVVSDSDELSMRILEQLLNREYSVEFCRVPNYEALKEGVRSKQLECGYVFDSSLTEKYRKKQYDNSILQVQGNSEFIPSMAKEILFSAVFSVCAKDMAVDYVDNSQIFEKHHDRAKEMVANSYDAYMEGSGTFYMKFSRLEAADNGRVVAIDEKEGLFPVRGILAVLVYLAGLFGCVQWKMDKEKGVFLTMSHGFFIVSRPLYAMIPTFLFAVSAEVTMAVTNTADYPAELWRMLLYVVGIVLFSWLLNFIIPSSRGAVAVIPVLLTLSMVLCPIFVNILTTVPAAKYLARLLLPYYYLL